LGGGEQCTNFSATHIKERWGLSLCEVRTVVASDEVGITVNTERDEARISMQVKLRERERQKHWCCALELSIITEV
jgi:hypothetical protein